MFVLMPSTAFSAIEVPIQTKLEEIDCHSPNIAFLFIICITDVLFFNAVKVTRQVCLSPVTEKEREKKNLVGSKLRLEWN
jgi:hypothetical protein